MTEYHLNGVRADPDGSAFLSIVVGKNTKLARIQLDRESLLQLLEQCVVALRRMERK